MWCLDATTSRTMNPPGAPLSDHSTQQHTHIHSREALIFMKRSWQIHKSMTSRAPGTTFLFKTSTIPPHNINRFYSVFIKNHQIKTYGTCLKTFSPPIEPDEEKAPISPRNFPAKTIRCMVGGLEREVSSRFTLVIATQNQ